MYNCMHIKDKHGNKQWRSKVLGGAYGSTGALQLWGSNDQSSKPEGQRAGMGFGGRGPGVASPSPPLMNLVERCKSLVGSAWSKALVAKFWCFMNIIVKLLFPWRILCHPLGPSGARGPGSLNRAAWTPGYYATDNKFKTGGVSNTVNIGASSEKMRQSAVRIHFYKWQHALII